MGIVLATNVNNFIDVKRSRETVKFIVWLISIVNQTIRVTRKISISIVQVIHDVR